MTANRSWNEKGKGTRRKPSCQPRGTTERQDRHLRQLALRDSFATIGDQWLKEKVFLSVYEPYNATFKLLGFFSHRLRLVFPLTAIKPSSTS